MKTPKYRFYRIRYAYLQLLVTSLVLNQWPTERHGALTTHSYKLDGSTRQTVKRQIPKSRISTCLTLPGKAWFVLLLRTCQQMFLSRYKPPRIGEIANKTTNQKLQQSRRRRPPKNWKKFLSTIKVNGKPDQLDPKPCHGQKITDTVFLELLRYHVQSGELLHMAYSLQLWKL